MEELRDALVELRAAEDVARGETWPAGIPQADVADTERRAYVALAEQRRALRAARARGRTATRGAGAGLQRSGGGPPGVDAG